MCVSVCVLGEMRGPGEDTFFPEDLQSEVFTKIKIQSLVHFCTLERLR